VEFSNVSKLNNPRRVFFLGPEEHVLRDCVPHGTVARDDIWCGCTQDSFFSGHSLLRWKLPTNHNHM